jgi:ABC-type polysaccharide/polyol phosphate transport system ATPase subunit
MSETVIIVEKLSKRYLVGHQSARSEPYTALRDVIGREARNFARKTADLLRGRQVIQGDEVEEFWALKNVSFEVKQGQVLGIIGRNGAGKSTLLKVLSRITEPSDGRVVLRGRVASLLEVGTGFHSELTGRENIFLNGAVLGMTRREIRKKFDEIVSFSGVEKFIDTPVKRYSSGMYVRLAFAVAAHLEPEILIVDEVLAVGDAEFQKKCLGKMDEVSRREGRTVLLVSHNMGVVTSLCPLAIWLDHGSIRQHGDARNIIGDYLIHGVSNKNRVIKLDELPRRVDGNEDRLRLQSIEWLCAVPLQHGEPVKARIHFITRSPLVDVSVGIGFSNLEGGRVLSYGMYFQDDACQSLPRPGAYSVDIDVSSLLLAPDIYNLEIGCRSGDSHGLDYVLAAQLEVVAGPTTPGYIVRKNMGACDVNRWVWNDQKGEGAGKEYHLDR